MNARSSVRSKALKEICMCTQYILLANQYYFVTFCIMRPVKVLGRRQWVDTGAKVDSRDIITLTVFSQRSADWRVLRSNT